MALEKLFQLDHKEKLIDSQLYNTLSFEFGYDESFYYISEYLTQACDLNKHFADNGLTIIQ